MPVWCDNCDREGGYPGHPFDPCIRCDGEDKPEDDMVHNVFADDGSEWQKESSSQGEAEEIEGYLNECFAEGFVDPEELDLNGFSKVGSGKA